MVLIRRLIGWLGRFARWLAEPIRFWVFVLCTAVVATIAWVLADSWEQGFRFAGLFYQWLGIGTVAYGLHQTRKIFQRPTILALVGEWLSQFPPWKKDTRIVVGTGHLKLSGGTVRARGQINPAPGTPLEDRVRFLEDEVGRLRDASDALGERIVEEVKRLDSAVESERKTREADDQQIRRLLEEALAGGLRIEWMGAFWLFVGVMLGTVPTDIVSLLGLR
jgi:hypothetical protein